MCDRKELEWRETIVNVETSHILVSVVMHCKYKSVVREAYGTRGEKGHEW